MIVEINEVGLTGLPWMRLSDRAHIEDADLINRLLKRLPPSLEELIVLDCTIITLRCLTIYIDIVKLNFPSLERVSVQGVDSTSREFDDEVKRMGRAGIILKYTFSSTFSDY